MIVTLLTVLPLLVPGLVLLAWYLRTRRRFTAGRLVVAVGFAIYLLQVSDYTIFPLEFGTWYVETMRSQTRLLDGINLVPFRDLSIEYLVSVQGWGNVALGGPFGFLYPLVFGSSGWRRMARAGVLFGSAIELTQLTISLLYGFAYRVIDVNDVLLNFIGVMLGYALLRATALLYRRGVGRVSQESGPQDEGVWGHIKSVLLARNESVRARAE